MVLTQKYYDGKVPDKSNSKWKFHGMPGINDMIKKIELQIETYHFREGLARVMNLARIGNKFLTEREPWHKIKTNPEEVADVLHVCLQFIAKISIVMEPFMPFTAKKIRILLNINNVEYEWDDSYRNNLLSEGHQLASPELIFTKIEDEEVQLQLKKLNDTKKTNDSLSKNPNTASEISIDDYAKMQIMIVTVLAAEKIQNTDKLMKLTIDLGTEIRTIVSGIAHQYKPEEVVGRQVCYLANLKPRQLKGIESKGMVLMVKDEEGRLVFLSPEKIVKIGSEVG
jgi:methionyl-tRNA synthetase